MPVDSDSPEKLFSASQMAISLLYPHMAEEIKKLSENSFIRAPIPFMETPPS